MTRMWNRITPKSRTTIVVVVFITLGVGIGIASQRWYEVHSRLIEHERVIKEALRHETLDSPLSNTSDGVERFLDTGQLVFESRFFLHPEELDEVERYRIRVHPRITTHRDDGWVGMHMGQWYVKLM